MYVPEHADLALDVSPLSRSALSDKVIVELVTHADNPVRHMLDLVLPLVIEAVVVQNGGSNASTTERGVGVHGADNDLELTLNTSLLLGIGGDQRERADALTVQTHILREGLRHDDLVAFRHEVADGKSVASKITRSKALVGHVEEGEELLLLDNVGDLLPLLRGGVNASGVVGTRMEKNDGLLGHALAMRISIPVSKKTGYSRTLRSSFRPAKSRPTVFLSKYR